MATNPEIGATVEVHGIATNYHDRGDGPPVLLLHGSGPGVSAYANWRLTLPALAGPARVLAPDLVGFGYTAAPAGFRFDPGSWTRHLLGFLDALHVPRVSVVGNSFGGALALRLAAECPDRVDRLVLMGAVGVSFPLTAGLDAVWGHRPSADGMRRLMEWFAFDADLVTGELAEVRHRAATRPGVAEAYAAMFPAPRQRWIDALALPERRLREIRQPALVLHGREDRVIPLSASLRLASLLDSAELHVFPHCGHWVQIEAHRRFTELVAGFLAGGPGVPV